MLEVDLAEELESERWLIIGSKEVISKELESETNLEIVFLYGYCLVRDET